ncbi:T9SS type A sorting domain-containing protein [Brumimicrobium salinarum]|uniref:T9SS type A sorting domain-containing protein n=1 Tax=Brumimicrobium salinarum TaxID=2058658 RepID=UPI0013FD9EA1|nr:T9SS type A sorting domain-containing protein [Brumimicrobium salinarum]
MAVNISLNEEVNGQLYITDMNGRVLKTAFDNQILRAGDSRHQLATESLSKGIYLVHLIVGGERHVKRLVKQ